ASFVPVLLLFQPQQGIFRDWDVFAPAGAALSVLTASLVADSVRGAQRMEWIVIPLVAGVLVPSLQWLAINYDTDRGLSRVRTYLIEEPRPPDRERALIWDFLCTRYTGLGRWPEAADAAANAVRLAPHRRLFLMWALAETY